MTRIGALLVSVLMAAPVGASFDEAMTLYRAKDYPGAVTEFRRLAEIGDHAAQFNIGIMYYRGESVGPDPIEGYAWVALANQTQDATWQRVRDQIYAGLSESQKGLADAARESLFLRLSDQALAKQLAPVLEGAGSDLRESRVKKRVAPNYPTQMAREGKGGWVDVVYAVGVDGTTRLHGILVATNEDFAIAALDALKQWQYEPARLNGKPVEEYGRRLRFFFKMEGSEANRSAIRSLIDDLRGKAEQGGAVDAYRYASALEMVSGISKLPSGAGNPNEWYWKAAARGNAAAQFSLGNNLLYGNACTPDSLKGLKWLQRAAEAGQPEAQYVLAIDMLSGARLAPDRAAGLKWLERAATSDFSPAKLKLAWLTATSPDQQFRNVNAAQGYLDQIPKKFIDRLSLLEARAAVAAASGSFKEAERLQQDAVREARHYDLPTEAPLARLTAYQARKLWVDTE